MCDGAPVRGEIVSIGNAWQAVLERRNDPPCCRTQNFLGDFVGRSNASECQPQEIKLLIFCVGLVRRKCKESTLAE